LFFLKEVFSNRSAKFDGQPLNQRLKARDIYVLAVKKSENEKNVDEISL
jgi:hypothetical protein